MQSHRNDLIIEPSAGNGSFSNILFDEYKTLNDVITDVKKVIEGDSGFGTNLQLPPIPSTPEMKVA